MICNSSIHVMVVRRRCAMVRGDPYIYYIHTSKYIVYYVISLLKNRTCVYVCIYIYIYIEREREREIILRCAMVRGDAWDGKPPGLTSEPGVLGSREHEVILFTIITNTHITIVILLILQLLLLLLILLLLLLILQILLLLLI